MGNEVLAGIVGAAGGAAAAYFLPSMFKPKITITPNPATAGQLIIFSYTGFPPNTPLMGMGGGTRGIGSAPYNLGATDAAGNLQLQGPAPSNLIAGDIILYVVFAADDPRIFATAIYIEA